MGLAARMVAMLLAAAVLGGGCTRPDPRPGDTEAEPTRLSETGPTASTEPSQSTAARAAPTTPEEAVHVVALSAEDLPGGWTVEESPTDADIGDDPTFQGLCGYEFRSEARRTSKVPVTGIDPQGDAVLTSEAVSYDSPEAAELVLVELRSAYAQCPPDQTFTDLPSADQSGLAEDRVVVEYTLAEGTTQTVIAQRRGAVVSVVLGEARLIAFDAARRIFARMLALSAEAAGEV